MVTLNSILRKKSLKDWKNHHNLYLMIISISALAVCLLVGFLANHLDFKSRSDIIAEKGKLADIFLDYDDNSISNKIEEISNVKETDKRVIIPALLSKELIKLVGYESFPSLNIPYNIEGQEGLLINKEYAKSKNITIGSNITIKVFAPSSLLEFNNLFTSSLKPNQLDSISEDGTILLTIPISGYMEHPETINFGDSIPTLFYASSSDISNWLLNSLNSTYDLTLLEQHILPSLQTSLKPNQILIKLKDSSISSKSASEIKSKLADLGITDYKLYERNNYESTSPLLSDVKQSLYLTYVFPIVFFIVAFLVIITTFSQIIIKERSQISLMKALGVRNKEIYLHYFSLSTILITIGFVLGSAVGVFLIPFIMSQKYDLLFQLPKLRYLLPWKELIISFLAIQGVVLFISYLILSQEVKKMPSESIVVKQSKVSSQPKRDFKFNFYLTTLIRNVFINWKKSLMVVIGILGCTTLLISGFGIDDTINYGLNNDFNKLYNYDIELTYGIVNNMDEIKQNPRIKKLENFSSLPINIPETGDSTQLRIIENNSSIVSYKINKGECGISTKLVRKGEIKIGDTISLNIKGITTPLKVAFTYEAEFYHGVLTVFDSFDFPLNPTNGWILTNNKEDSTLLVNELTNNNLVISAISKTKYLDKVDSMLSGIKLMTLTLKVFAIGLAIVVLINIALLNYQERARDIATLKVIGLRNTEIGISLLLEIIFLTLIGILVGCFLGLPMTYLILKINETPVISFLYHIDFISYLFSIGLTLLTSFVVNLVLIKFSDKVDMNESLKSYE